MMTQPNNNKMSIEQTRGPIWFGLLGLSGIVIIIANLLNITVICKFHSLRTRTNAILASLGAVDLLTGLILIIQYFVSIQLKNQSTPPELWTIIYILTSYPVINSGFHLVLVTVERYIAILYPLHYHVYFTNRRAALGLVLCWLLSTLLAGWQLFYLIRFDHSVQLAASCSSLQVAAFFNWTCLIIASIITGVIVVFYVRIYIEIKKQHCRIQGQLASMPEGNVSQLKFTKIISFTVACFVICWWPAIISIILGLVHNNATIGDVHQIEPFSYFADILVCVNSVMNPIIYATRLTAFKKAYDQLFHCQRCQAVHPQT